MPSHDYLLRDATIFQKWLIRVNDKNTFDNLDIVSCINTILMHMKRYLILENSIFEFNKFKTISAYLDTGPDIIDDEIFSFVEHYIKGETKLPWEQLDKLRRFTKSFSDYYNNRLLGISPT